MAQFWLSIPPKPDGYPFTHGEAICTFYFISGLPPPHHLSVHFTVKKASKVHITLSRADDRSYAPICGRAWYDMDFVVFKRGVEDAEWVGESSGAYRWTRNAYFEHEMMEEGDYVVFVRSSFSKPGCLADERSPELEGHSIVHRGLCATTRIKSPSGIRGSFRRC